MSSFTLPSKLAGIRFHMVGIKGTGMCALAELLVAEGAIVSGSDVDDVFYTDKILAELGIESLLFNASNIGPDVEYVVYSAAYSPETHVELLAARDAKIPTYAYPQALGAFSSLRPSYAISGVHGKTTTTAITGSIIKALRLPATVLAGSAVGAFGDKSTLSVGKELFVAETCEYRRHFLEFSPQALILTSVEPDHQDYYPDYHSIRAAFVEFLHRLPHGGRVFYCADDKGACDTMQQALQSRPDIVGVPYGFSADGRYRIESWQVANESSIFRLAGFPCEFSLHIPGRHIVLDACAAIALCVLLLEEREGKPCGQAELSRIIDGLAAFTGSRRRYEVVGEAGGILFMDDYGHHPTAIRATLRGLREFYPTRRLVVDFMSHTYTRTAALFEEFAESFQDADHLVMHKIYASAREPLTVGVSGKLLFEATNALRANVVYFEEPMEALPWLKGFLKPQDLFLTIGAGDNWKLGHALFAEFKRDR